MRVTLTWLNKAHNGTELFIFFWKLVISNFIYTLYLVPKYFRFNILNWWACHIRVRRGRIVVALHSSHWGLDIWASACGPPVSTVFQASVPLTTQEPKLRPLTEQEEGQIISRQIRNHSWGNVLITLHADAGTIQTSLHSVFGVFTHRSLNSLMI